MNRTSEKQENRIRTVKAKLTSLNNYVQTIDQTVRACENEINAVLDEIAVEKAEQLKKTLATPSA